jgi:hypothetical protein
VIARPTPDLNEIERAVSVIVGYGKNRIVEVRAPGTPKGTWSGYYNKGALIQDVFDMSSVETTPAVYWTIQDIDNSLLKEGGENKLFSGVVETTKDSHVKKYVWLPIDCDPTRDGKVSSTDEEKAEAESVAYDIRRFLNELGIPSVFADSGNGYHILLRLEIPNQNGTSRLVEETLRAFSARFSNKAVNIDTTVFNPSRILKIYGSVSRKGQHTDERPWRTSRLIDVPANPTPLSETQLKNLLTEVLKGLTPEAQ